MDLSLLPRKSDTEWWIEPHGRMRVPGVIYASEALVKGMDAKVYEQVENVATLPGIEKASYAMPDAHWGYGFPIGGVAAFDADRGGVVSAGGVGFDISCGVRLLHTGLTLTDVEPLKKRLADELSRSVPAGVGSVGRLHLDAAEMDAMLTGGADGPPNVATALRPSSSGLRSTAACRARSLRKCPRARRIASATRWAHSDLAITISSSTDRKGL